MEERTGGPSRGVYIQREKQTLLSLFVPFVNRSKMNWFIKPTAPKLCLSEVIWPVDSRCALPPSGSALFTHAQSAPVPQRRVSLIHNCS